MARIKAAYPQDDLITLEIELEAGHPAIADAAGLTARLAEDAARIVASYRSRRKQTKLETKPEAKLEWSSARYSISENNDGTWTAVMSLATTGERLLHADGADPEKALAALRASEREAFEPPSAKTPPC